MTDRWQPNVKIKDQVDVNDPSFPWYRGRPDWDAYRAIKNEERRERNKNRKQSRLPERCCAVEDDGQLCRAKSLGKIELEVNGVRKVAPLCQKHKNLLVKDDRSV